MQFLASIIHNRQFGRVDLCWTPCKTFSSKTDLRCKICFRWSIRKKYELGCSMSFQWFSSFFTGAWFTCYKIGILGIIFNTASRTTLERFLTSPGMPGVFSSNRPAEHHCFKGRMPLQSYIIPFAFPNICLTSWSSSADGLLAGFTEPDAILLSLETDV